MREVRRSALVSHSPAAMYALVNDVARYPEFVPGCRSSRILEQTPTSIRATLELAKAGVGLSITTQNQMLPGEWIDMGLVDGPLKSFSGRWDFVPIRAAGAGPADPVRGCRVELVVRFAFRNAALDLLLGPLFEATWNSIVDAFVRRAREVHGG
jgi:ribosome-associated toxin RatA of RatAB toxin-antitoxin module